MFPLRMSLTLIVLATLTAANVSADEPTQEKNPTAKVEAAEKKALTPANDAALKKMLAAPTGVFDPEYNDDGVLLRLKIKGEAETTTGLRAVRADRLAREKAERLVKAAFVKFLKEEVSVRENDQEEVIIIEKDGEEQAGYKNVSTTQIETKAQGLLRGLIVLVDQVEGEGANRKAMVIFGWSQKLADAARTARGSIGRDKNPVGDSTTNKGENSGSSGDKTRTADNLTDF